MIGIIQILTVEEQQRYDTATDCRIGKVENRAEEDEMVSTYERHPRNMAIGIVARAEEPVFGANP